MKENAGNEYLKGTKYKRSHLPRHRLDWSIKPETYKHYPDAEIVSLPQPTIKEGVGLWSLLNRRRSVREYADTPITVETLSQLLWATQGITATRGGFGFRTAPSAGALYPVETYLSIHRVERVEPGFYHYCPDNHQLELLKKGDFRQEVARGALDQAIAANAAVVFIWSGIFQRSKWKYLERAYRYVFLDAGHIAQNLALAAEALSLGSCQIGALYDDELNELLEFDGEKESVIYMSSVAHKKRIIEV